MRAVKPENVLLFDYTLPQQGSGAAMEGVGGYPHADLRQKLLRAASKKDLAALQGYMVKMCDFGSALLVDTAVGGPAIGMSPRGSAAYACPEVCALSLLARDSATGEATQLFGDTESVKGTLSEGYDAFAADVWSWAVMAFTCVAGHLPFRTAHAGSSTFRAFVLATQPEALQGPLSTVLCANSSLWAPTGGSGAPASAGTGQWRWPAAMSPALVHLLQGCLRVDSSERWSMSDVVGHPWFSFPEWTPEKGSEGMLPQLEPGQHDAMDGKSEFGGEGDLSAAHTVGGVSSSQDPVAGGGHSHGEWHG